MYWIERLRKLFGEEKEAVSKSKEQISLGEMHTRVGMKMKKNLDKRMQLRAAISERMNQLNSEVKEAIVTLKNVNLAERKENERIKFIVIENLSAYISHLQKAVDNLRAINNLESREGIQRIFLIAHEFNKAARMPFEKATILVGKELQTAKETMALFLRDADAIAKNNQVIFEETETGNRLERMFLELTENRGYEEEMSTKKRKIDEDIARKNEEISRLQQRIDSIKKDESYQRDMQEKRAHEEKARLLESELQLIKQKIDFRLLAKHFHHDAKKSKLIREYADNFRESVEKDAFLLIAEFVKEAQGIALKELEELRNRMRSQSGELITQTDKDLAVLEAHRRELHASIASMNASLEDESRKMKKLSAKKEKLITEIKGMSQSLFPEIEVK